MGKGGTRDAHAVGPDTCAPKILHAISASIVSQWTAVGEPPTRRHSLTHFLRLVENGRSPCSNIMSSASLCTILNFFEEASPRAGSR
jgi:hypothetical protein